MLCVKLERGNGKNTQHTQGERGSGKNAQHTQRRARQWEKHQAYPKASKAVGKTMGLQLGHETYY